MRERNTRSLRRAALEAQILRAFARNYGRGARDYVARVYAKRIEALERECDWWRGQCHEERGRVHALRVELIAEHERTRELHGDPG